MMNLNSIWSQVVGADSSEEDDSFQLKQSLPTEDDIAASALLSQFPPFGHFKVRNEMSQSPTSGGERERGSPSSPVGNAGGSSGAGSMPPSSPRMRKAMNGNVAVGGRGPPITVRSKYLQSKGVVGPTSASGTAAGTPTSQEEYLHLMRTEQQQYPEKEEGAISSDDGAGGNGGAGVGVGALPPGGRKSNQGEGLGLTSHHEDGTIWKSEEQNLWYSSTEDETNNGTKSTRSKKGTRKVKKKSSSSKQQQAHSKRIVMEDLTELRQSWIIGKLPSPSNVSDSSSLQGVVLPTPSPATSNKSQQGAAGPGGPTSKTSINSRHFTFTFDDGESTTCSSSSISYGDEDDSQINSVLEQPPSSPATLPLISNQFKSSWKKHEEDTSHWMPDQFAKQCYACESQFTVFRRRHHCRLCGQVFCSRCSSSFVEIHGDRVRTRDRDNQGSSNGGGEQDEGGMTRGRGGEVLEDVRTIRTCQTCHDQVAKSGRKGLSWFGMENNGNTALPNLERRRSDNSLERDDTILKLSTNSSESTNTSLNDKFGHTLRKFHPAASVPPEIQESDEDSHSTHSHSSNLSNQLVGFRTTGSPNEFSNLAIVKQTMEEKRIQREEQEKFQQTQSERESQAKVGIVGKRLTSTTSSIRGRFGRLAESAAREAQVGAGFDDEEAKLIGTGVKISNEYEMTKEDSRITNKEQITLPPPNDGGGIDVKPGVSREDEYAKSVKAENRRLGRAAADHLEDMARELLISEAPVLLREIKNKQCSSHDEWIEKLMELITRCCATVNTNVRSGDTLDIRPYCKVKVIPGGVLNDSAYMSGVVFHKNVSHKAMAKEILNPRVLLLSGGIEFTRTENRIASLDTLLEQEAMYMEILIAKISKLKPDILMVGRSVVRKAQELLLKTNIILLQHVKPSLMERIARQTSATILSSTDHVMNQLFGTSVLGKCRRFRLVSFRDDDVWRKHSSKTEESLSRNFSDAKNAANKINSLVENLDDRKNIDAVLATTQLSYHQRQAILAANLLGDKVHDGGKAVKSGIAKRGVSSTYVMIEGCDPSLGCTVVLRGASRPALKQVKTLFNFLLNAAYNIRLETSYFRDRRTKLPDSYLNAKEPIVSSSLCVDYGFPQSGRKIRPWNGGGNYVKRSLSGKITALDHQSILISSVWMAGKTQCCPAEVKGICYYSKQDVSLGQFLRDSCFNLTLKCQNPNCSKSVLDHTLTFIHNDGLLSISVEELEDPIPAPPPPSNGPNAATIIQNPIATWSHCDSCVTPLSYISEDTWKFSFGKFLEVSFYNKTLMLNSPGNGCDCPMQNGTTLYFGCGNLAARFTYEQIRPYGVYLRRYLSFDEDFHRDRTVKELNTIMVSSSELFEKFEKHVERTSWDTRQLFGSAANKPEHLQTVLYELNAIGKEVVHASDILHEKIVSVTNRYNSLKQANVMNEINALAAQEALTYFPWHARRYLFMLASAWNERLNAIGQALSAMKKLAAASQRASTVSRGDTVISQNVIADSSIDEVLEGMLRLRQLREYYSNMNVSDMSVQPTGREPILLDSHSNIDDHDDFDDHDDYNNIESEVDADVLASRRRFAKHNDPSHGRHNSRGRAGGSYDDKEDYPDRMKVNKPPRRRSGDHSMSTGSTTTRENTTLSSRSQSPSQAKSKTVTSGIKSALTTFFQKRKEPDYVVDLGMFGEGRPKLEPGIDGVVIPVFDDQPSTIIAHSLSSHEYESQFKRFRKKAERNEAANGNDNVNSAEDFFAGPGGLESPTERSRPNSSSSKRRHQRNNSAKSNSGADEIGPLEKRLLMRNKSHIKHTFRDYDEKGKNIAKFVCTTYWSTQFQAVRQAFLHENTNSVSLSHDIEKNYVKSLSSSATWDAIGGKSGASFSRTADERFIVKCISRTELQMFLDCAPAYFEYLSKAFFHGLPTMLCKIVGVYQIGYHNRLTSKRTMEQVAVMQNIFYGRNISRVFDLKGSLRGRFAKNLRNGSDREPEQSKGSSTKQKREKNRTFSDAEASSDDDSNASGEKHEDRSTGYLSSEEDDEGIILDTKEKRKSQEDSKVSEASSTMLDGDFIEFTGGRPLPLTDRAKAAFHMSILNDTLFLSIINVLDYSMLVGIDEEKNELVVGIIDFMRQYDILKQMERVGKSIPMVVGSEAPTIIQPPLYKNRFINAMERYFMNVPNKWTNI